MWSPDVKNRMCRTDAQCCRMTTVITVRFYFSAGAVTVLALCFAVTPCLPDQSTSRGSTKHVLSGASAQSSPRFYQLAQVPRFERCASAPALLHLRGGRTGREKTKGTKRSRSKRSAKGEEEEVGLPYQTSTPLLSGHQDVPEERSARSYAAEAARCLLKLDPDGALACYEEALKLEPRAPWLLDAYGSLLADLGRVDEALVAFNASYALEVAGGAEPSHIRHMYLGQAYPGEEGLDHLRRGVHILNEKFQARSSEGGEHEEESGGARGAAQAEEDWGPKLCTARCALAEALLAHDDEGGADEEAEEELRKAMELNPDSADPHQGFAGLRLSQGRGEEAGEYMQSVLRVLAETPAERMPAIDFRLQSAKLLIELGLAQDAIKLLHRIEQERDDIGELWYLLCYAYRLAGREIRVQECARKGKRYLRSVGGLEQARHPITGEELTVEDFEDIVQGVGATDGDVEAMERAEAQQQRQEMEMARKMQINAEDSEEINYDYDDYDYEDEDDEDEELASE